MKKLISVILAVCMIGSAVSAFAENTSEKKRYVVILDEAALYSPERPVPFRVNSDEYLNEMRAAMLELQEEIKEQIPKSGMSLFSMDEENDEFSYTDVLNGFTVTTDEKTVEKIRLIDGVRDVIEDCVIATVDMTGNFAQLNEVQSDTTSVSMANSASEINVSYAYENGYDGTGRAIAILDSNIYYNNSYFKLSDEDSVKYTKNDIADIMNEKNVQLSVDGVYKSAKVPFAYDYAARSYTLSNSSHHGTHVSGIAAGLSTKVGDGAISGVAPESQILFFGVANANGAINFSVVVKAINDAVKFGVDAMNMSFGEINASENQTDAVSKTYREVVLNAENSGCSMNFSAGNSGRGDKYETKYIEYSTSDNNHHPNSTKVGSVHGGYFISRALKDEKDNVYRCMLGSPSITFPLTETVDCKYGSEKDIESLDINGKVAVVSLNEPFSDEGHKKICTRIRQKGAAAIVLINYINQVPDSTSAYAYPVFVVAKSVGEKILENATKLVYEGKLSFAKNYENPTQSYFSSYAVSDDLGITVDFAAPGGNIYSAYSTGFTTMSGTSMAAPHITGAVALMYPYVEKEFPQHKGNQKVRLVRNLLASTAQNVYEENGAISSVRAVGSGLIQIDRAMQTKVILHNEDNRVRINLGDNVSDEFSLKFYAENLSDEAVTFDSVTVNVSTDDYKHYETLDKYVFSGIRKLEATLDGDSAVTIEPKSTKEVNLTVKLDKNELDALSAVMTNGLYIDGKVILSATDESHVPVGIPFLGFYGDWSSQKAIEQSSFENNFRIMADSGAYKLYATLEKDGEFYNVPFTSEPDADIKNLPMELDLKSDRNVYMRVSLNGSNPQEFFIRKNTAEVLQMFRVENLSSYIEKGDVVLTIEFYLPYDTTKKPLQTIKLKFTEDNVPSVVNSITVSGEKIIINTTDNHAISTILDEYYDGSGVKKGRAIYPEKTMQNTAVSLVGEKHSFYVYDCAFNKTSLDYGVGISIKENFATVKNHDFGSLGGKCYLATYDKGKMVSVNELGDGDLNLASYQNKEYDISEYSSLNYKIFYLNGTTLKPQCENFPINEQK